MRLTVDLPPDASRLVEEAVRSGGFPDANAVVIAALQALGESGDDLLGYDIEDVRRLGDEGERSGPGRPLDTDDIMRKVRERVGSTTSET